VALLMVHGLLHLLGYDDTDDASRARMHARQEELVMLADVGLGPRDAL
jgi:rRNA maturation RNase YbeY